MKYIIIPILNLIVYIVLGFIIAFAVVIYLVSCLWDFKPTKWGTIICYFESVLRFEDDANYTEIENETIKDTWKRWAT